MSLENLLVKGYITFEEYVRLLPMGSSMPKSDLELLMKARQEVKQKLMAQQKMINQINGALQRKLQMDGANAMQGQGQMQQQAQPNIPTEQGGMQNAVQDM